MAVYTQTVLDSITDITKDVDHVRWPLTEIARWLNQAQSQIASLHPRAAADYYTLELVAGARQDLRTIDADVSWVRLHDLVCNVSGSDPTGATIRRVSRPALDFAFRTWRAKAATATAVKEFSMDERSPFVFDVWPPVVAGTKVLGLASVRPGEVCVLNSGGTALANVNETIGLADGFEVPMIDYALFRMFSKDANDPNYAQRAGMHLQAFNFAMGVETKDAKAE
jgi:hypothetical protein